MFSHIAKTDAAQDKSGKTSVDLRKRFQMFLFLFIVVIFSFIIVFFIGFDIFSPHKDATALLNLQMDRYAHRLETYFNNTAAHGIQFSRQVSREIEKTLYENSAEFKNVSDNHALIAAIEGNTYDLLYNSLRIADCSGSFIILDATVNTKLLNAKYSRAGTFLKLANVNNPRSVSPMVFWTRGAHDIGHANDIIFHNQWQLEFDISRLPFYSAVLKNASKNLEERYYYSPAFPFHGTGEKIMLLCVPIVGKSGQVFGMCGFAIGSMFFKLLQAETAAYFTRAIGLVAQKEDASIRLETGLEFGTKDGYFAGLGAGILNVVQENGLGHYRLNESAADTTRDFMGLDRKIFLSPLSDKLDTASWAIICMIPKEDYDHMVYRSYLKLAVFCTAFLAITFFFAYYISRRYHLPIAQGIHAIKGGASQKTYVTEIDDLLEFLAVNDTLHNADMSAFYKFKENLRNLSRAETAVFNLYMEGYSAEEIAARLYVSINTIKSHNKSIYRKLNVSSRKELMVYVQMMKISG